MGIKIKKSFNLSDKILLIIFTFTTFLLVLIKIIVGGSYIQILFVSYIVYNLTFLITYLLSKRFSKRLVNLSLKIQAIAAGDLSSKLKSSGQDEISQLSNSVNELISRLKTGVAQDVSKHQELSKAKTDFVTLASHQLRTPLSIIKWYVDFLLNEDAGEITEEQKKYLKEVYVSNERLIELVNALLDVSRIDVGTFSIEPEPMDMLLLADQAINKYLPELNKKEIKFIKEYEKIPIINLDPRLTKIVFENIFSNAVKYTPEKGVIKMIIKKTDKDVLIKISDSGCGIPREQQPKMFTKLFRADNVRKIESVGTGLGLYIVKAVIEKSGGKIWFQSPSLDLIIDKESEARINSDVLKNKGTTFYITIPLKGMKKKTGSKKLTSIN